MGKELWQEVLEVANEKGLPESPPSTEQSRSAYESALDIVNSYRGDPSVLFEALERFRGCGSAAFANAGVAAVLMFASYQRGDEYDGDGLRAAESFLRKAQQMHPKRPEIDHLDAKLCLLRKNDAEARRILDAVHRTNPQSFFAASIELWYWYNQRNIPKAEYWYRHAKSVARSKPQRLLVAQQLAGCYQSSGDVEKSISAHKELVAADPNDPWAWHNLSLMQLERGRIKEAEASNAAALRLMDFSAAREVKQAIQKKKGGFWSW